jgi:hypothetical protein
MAKLRLNGYTKEFIGRVGTHVWTRRANGTIVASVRPDRSHVVSSPNQDRTQNRFRKVVARVKAIREDDPTTWAPFVALALEKKESAFALAVAEYFTFPFIDVIDLAGYHGLPGDPIVIAASGDMAITNVDVRIQQGTRQEGVTPVVFESGAALKTPTGWTYAATTTPPTGQVLEIVVTAKDRLGHETSGSAIYP